MDKFDKILQDMKLTHDERAAVYGFNYAKIGTIMKSFFPDGLTLKEIEQHDNFHFFFMIVVKLSRLAETDFNHKDSIRDIAVYAALWECILKDGIPTDEELADPSFVNNYKIFSENEQGECVFNEAHYYLIENKLYFKKLCESHEKVAECNKLKWSFYIDLMNNICDGSKNKIGNYNELIFEAKRC